MGAQTFNRYNLFYRLERQLLLFERGANPSKQDESRLPSEREGRKYDLLVMPPLPPRYQHLEMPDLWFLSSKSSAKKRSHRKSHGVASFTEIAQIVASNWKAIDEETMNFVTDLSAILKEYVNEHGIDTDGKNNNNNTSPKGPPSSSKKDKSTTSKDNKKKLKKRASQSLEESPSPLQEEKRSFSYDMLQSVLNPQDNNNGHDYRSATPVASNCTTPYTFADVFGLSSTSTKDGSVANNNMPNLISLSSRSSSCEVMPSPTASKSNSSHTVSDDNLLSNMEQSFLSHIFSDSQSTDDTRATVDTSDPQEGHRQPVGNLLVDNPQPSIADLLAVMSGNNANTTIGSNLQGYHQNNKPHRRSSMPGILPSGLSRMQLKGSLKQQLPGVQSEGSSNPSYSNAPKRQRTRRASDLGPHPYNTITNANAGEGRIQELDIRDDEIFAMWRTSSPGPWTPTGHNRAA